MSSYSKIRDELHKKYNTAATGNTGSTNKQATTKKNEGSYDEIRNTLLNKYSSENTNKLRTAVSSWVDRFNAAKKGISDYTTKRNGGYTTDVSGGFGREIDALIQEYEGIKDYADRMGLPNAKRYVTELREMQASIKEGNDYMSQFANEAEYDTWKKATEEREAMMSYDTKKGAKEIKGLEKVLKEYKTSIRNASSESDMSRASEIFQKYGDERSIKSLISEKTSYLNRAKRLQEGIALSNVTGNDDFKDKNGYVTTKSDGWWDNFTSQFGMGYEDLTYEYINGAENGMRQEIINKAVSYDAKTEDFMVYDYMTEDQISIYNYHYARDGKEAADRYLDSIQETLNYQSATETANKLKDKTALELLFGVQAGADQFQSGIKNLLNTEDDYIAQTAYQMASGMVREDLADNGRELPNWMGGASLGQVAYDAITTTVNMAPSVMTSTVMNFIVPGSGAVVGSAMMGASATGNAYQEMLNLGYGKDQARTYSTLVGASEAGLQYLLGGISSLGGKISGNKLTKAMAGVDNAFTRFAVNFAGNMLSEGVEEGLQEILTPWFQNLIMHTDEDINWSEVAYSTLLGALTAGFMEGPSSIATEVNTYRSGRKLQDADISAQRLAELGKTFSADTVAYQLAGRVNENTGAYTMGRLFNEIGASLSEQNVTEITNALVAKGMDLKTARKNADVLAYVVEGGQLTDKQIAVIEGNEVLADVARSTLIDANTTWNQRTQGYNQALKALAEEMTSPKASRINPAQQSHENAPVSDTVDTQNKNGTEVNVKEADLSPDDGVRIETIAKLDNISAADANFILNTLRSNTNASAQVDSLGAREAYKYGFYGFSQEHMTTHGVFVNSLTDAQRRAIYETGRTARQMQVEAKQAIVKNSLQVAEKSTVSGKVHFEGNRNALTERQSASLTAMEKVADALGVQIYVFESELNERGQRIGANGWYDPKDSSIHIDLHAGNNGEGTMLFTAAHELTHHVRQWSPEKFKTMSDFLMQEYGRKGVNVDALVREQINKAQRNGRTISYDTAFEEVVADSMETMLSDGKVVEKLAKLKTQDKSLWQKIKDFIGELATKIRAVYDGLSPDSVEGRYVAEMAESIEKLQEMFTEGLVDASKNFQSAEKNTAGDGGELKFSLREFEDGTRFVDVQMDEHTFDGMTVAQMNQAVKPILMEKFAGKVIGIDNRVFVNGDSVNEYLHPSKSIDMDTRKAKLSAAGELDNLLDAGKALPNRSDGEDGHVHPDAIDFSYFRTIFKVGNEYFEGIVNIKNIKRGKLLKDITKIKNITQDIVSSYGQNPKSNFLRDVSMNSIRNAEGDVNKKFSDRDTDSVSNRSLLANAFEGVAQSDIERQKIQEYKEKISGIEAEEQKLSDLNKQIKELSFANGPRDKDKIRKLREEATKTTNRINIYDKQLLRLEASKPLQDVLSREKKKAYQRAEKKGKEALEAYREKALKTQQEMHDKWQESRKKGIDSRQRTAMRHKIQTVVKELNDLLLNESKKRHVPDNLKKAVAGALSILNMDTVDAEERAAKYAALIAKEQAKAEPDQDKIDSYTMTMENILRQGEKMGERLKELRDAYEEIQESDDPDIANAYDPVIAGAIRELTQTIGNTSIKNMTLDQLSDVYDMYRMVLTRVRDANKTLLENIKESISNLASRVIGEVRMTGGEHTYRAAILDPVRKFLWNNLKPVYAMEWIGSSTLTKVFNNVRAGEDVWAVDVTEARAFYLDKSKKYNYDSWDFEKKYRFESASGIEFELTLDQILSLYAYSKREQAHDHLRLGGFVFDSNIETYKEKGSKLIKYKVNTADAHQIAPELLADIISRLTKEQMGFVDDMQEYLSTIMGAKGNEVTSKMYGVKLFKEKFYFPLKSAQQFMFEQNEVSGEVKIKNSGFTNKVVAKANNPVILSNFMDVWAGHVNDMSMYHAFTLPLEDFNRVFNYNSPKKENQPPVSVKGTIQNAYSPAAVNYVKQLITDLNGGARTDNTTGIINKMMGLFKKGAVFASMSVVIQQPSAIARAAALVDTKYFIGPKVDYKRHKVLWDEVKRYAPVAIIKEMGYFDTNMGKSTQDFILGKEYSGFAEKMKALFTDSDYRDEALSKAPALADEIAWCSIWEAVKRETKAKNHGMDIKSEAFLKKVGERFTEVIVKTQVYDSVLSRSALMRSKDTGMKMTTAFMAEPTTSINMIADALLKGKRGNRKYARGAIGAVVASQILNAILVSFVYAARDDDENETYAEKYIGTFAGQALDSLNPAGYIPFIKDIVSIVKGYDVERSDMAVISDLWKACENLKKDTVSPYKKVEGFAGSIAQIFGLPVKNIMRDARSIYQTINSFVNGQQTTKAGIAYAVKSALPKSVGGGDVSNQEQLYEAYLSGDQTQISRVESRYKDQTACASAMRAAIKEHFLSDDINTETARKYLVDFCGDEADEAFWKIEEWLYKGEADAAFSKYTEFYGAVQTGKDLKTIIKKYTDHGVTASTLKEQITSYFKPLYIKMTTREKAGVKGYLLNAMTLLGDDRSVAEEKIGKWEFEGEYGFSYDDRVQQFKSGELTAADMKSSLMTIAGKTADEAAKTIVDYTREAYEDGRFTRSKAIDIMVTHGGLTEDEAESKLRYIDIKKQFPDTHVDDAWVDEYYAEIEISGISLEVFVDYRTQVKSITGDGKKERRMMVIDSMPISSAQKDALYYAEGWAASKLHEAPWR